ncbi:MAG TPA: hypothetical protein VMU53_17620, partial [Candidatus Sulfotelmatobacter sp.]|nr:hypothetical protein [Candidatus Sulfotelmatobacter sp.]
QTGAWFQNDIRVQLHLKHTFGIWNADDERLGHSGMSVHDFFDFPRVDAKNLTPREKRNTGCV